MIISPHSPGRQDPHKRARRIPDKRFMAGTAVMITLSYLTVVLACACTDGKYSRSSSAHNVISASVNSKSTNGDEELCKSMHERMLTLQALSTGSMLVAKISYIDVLIDEEVPRQTAIVNGFRPPGNRFAPAKVVNFQLSSVLRV